MKRLNGMMLLAALATWTMAAPAKAGIGTVFNLHMTGDQEPGGGDPDGSGSGTLTIYEVISPTGSTYAVDWDFNVNNILLPLSGAHIHNAPFGVNGGVVVNFDAQLQGKGLLDDDLAAVLANPSDYYVNLHNADYPGGAIRGQLPEPGTLGLLLMGTFAMIRRVR